MSKILFTKDHFKSSVINWDLNKTNFRMITEHILKLRNNLTGKSCCFGIPTDEADILTNIAKIIQHPELTPEKPVFLDAQFSQGNIANC